MKKFVCFLALVAMTTTSVYGGPFSRVSRANCPNCRVATAPVITESRSAPVVISQTTEEIVTKTESFASPSYGSPGVQMSTYRAPVATVPFATVGRSGGSLGGLLSRAQSRRSNRLATRANRAAVSSATSVCRGCR